MEAAAIAREEIVSRIATRPEAIRAGRRDFDPEARAAVERTASAARDIRSLWDWRNDLLHAGMRLDPLPGDRLAKNVRALVDEIARPAKTIIVSRHPGAIEWIKRQGIVGG
ncbi:hypothetical protein ACFOHS_08420 [Jhaorihella thermophila]